MTIYEKILAVIGMLRNSISRKAPKSSIAPEFSPLETYSVGRFVMYEDSLYQCTSAHNGPWNPSDFSRTTVAAAIAFSGGGVEPQVHADWDETDPSDPAFILNKPDSMAPTSHASTHGADGSDPVSPVSIGAVRAYRFVQAAVSGSGSTRTCVLSSFANNQLDMTDSEMSGVTALTIVIDSSPISDAMRDLWFVVTSGSTAPTLTWPSGTSPAGSDNTNKSAAANATTIFLVSEYSEGGFIVARQVIGSAS